MNRSQHVLSTIFLLVLFFVSNFTASTVQAEPLVPLHIQKGTNLISIARQYCKKESDWKTIAKINHLKSPYTIYSKKTILVPLSILLTETVSAKVASVSGSPRLITRNSQSSTLEKGDFVLPGQTIQTNNNEFVHLLYPDHKHTRIGPQSEMTLVYLMRLTDGNLKAEFSLTKGNIIHKLQQKLKANEHFQTRTPVTIAGVRGTEFRIKMPDSETNIVETLSGQVALDAAGKQIVLNKGKGSKIKKDQPPAPPRDLPLRPALPHIETAYRTLPVILKTPDQTTIEFVRLRITTDLQGSKTIAEQLTGSGQNFTLPALKDGQYHLFFTAIDHEGFESAPTDPALLYIRTNPAAPILSNPNSGMQTFEKTVDIRWLKSDLAKFYNIVIATNPDFDAPIIEQQTEDAMFTTSSLDPDTYFFKVQLATEDGFETLFSAPLSWTVLQQPELTGFDPVKPDDDTIKLQWPAMTDVAGYTLEIAYDKKFDNLMVSKEKLTEPSYTISNDLASGDYYVRICAVMNNGQQSPWTAPQTLTIEPKPLNLKPILIILGCVALILL